MKQSVIALAPFLFLLSPLSYGGVTMDLVTTDAAGNETGRINFIAQSTNLRMDDKGNGSRNSMIFLGDQFLVLDHRDKSYIVMDEAMLNEMSAQISDAMKEMEAQLANLPPEQRAMAEQMMKGQMGRMMGQEQAPPPKPRVEALGTGEWQTFKCKNYAVYEGDAKTQVICSADLGDIDGAAEMMQAFQGMARFVTKMTESMPMRSEAGINPGELIEQIGGFPVHTIDYRNGEVTGETSLESVNE
ncbi:MAG: hypothetical protein OEU90_06550, partial [Gammaproteobacteria bacterium]|nr:hypothetical protein [Gammaproteobacteria bacterium]